ncbi:MAG: ATP-binding protein, partial [Blastocatellia bacterium]|nr:ATP-binding protein [Blastocatellia bacterium]
EDIIADCELLLYGVADIEIAFGRKPKPSKKEKINVGRDVIIKTVMQLKPYINFVQFDLIDLKKIEVYVDRAKLNQVVFNLFQNAIKYCEEDKEKFRVKIEADIDNTNFIIKFKDWGIGIAAGFEEKIFESGFRTSEAKQRDVNGSGFGLTISRELMKEMGGDLRLVNSYKPTEFHLIIPKF